MSEKISQRSGVQIPYKPEFFKLAFVKRLCSFRLSLKSLTGSDQLSCCCCCYYYYHYYYYYYYYYHYHYYYYYDDDDDDDDDTTE